MSAVIELFKSILEVSLFASAMMVVVFLIKAIAKDRIKIKVISFLWLIVILRLCLPGMLESPVHVDELFPKTIQAQAAVEQQATQGIAVDYGQNDALGNPSANYVVSPEKAETTHKIAVAEPQTTSFFEEAFSFIKSLDLWLVAALVWIIGSAIVLVLTLKESIIFGLRIRKNSYPLTDAEILDIVAEHKKANRLRRNIKVSICSSIQMPLAFGVFTPHILLPLHMTDKLSKEHVNTILLHEVCHIKRCDIVKNYVCMLAKALHWFNPLVWISLKTIKEDMEFACDQRVLKFMKPGQEVKYCEALLHTTRFIKQKRVPLLTTSLCEGKSNLKERIIKMIQPKGKSKSVTTITLFLALVMILTCFTTACQPTPEENVVIGKGDNLSDLIQSTPNTSSSVSPSGTSTQTNDALYTKLAAPKHWNLKETALDNKLNITADVDLELPGVSQLPAATASLSEFTQEDLDKIANVLGVKGAVWTKTNVRTKEQIEEELIRDRAVIAEQKAKDNPDAALIKKAEETIAYNEQQYNNAPSESEVKNIEFKISDLSADGDDIRRVGFEGITQMDGQTFHFLADNTYSGDVVNRVAAYFGEAGFRGADIDKPYGVSLTKEQAAQQASDIAEQLTDELKLCYITPAASSQDEARNWGWACVFMREINGCPTAYETTEIGSSLEAVNVPVNYEKMIIVMDDAGMVSFNWGVPMKIKSIDNPDVSLLSFDKISQRATEQIAQSFADAVNEDIVDGIDWGDPGCTASIQKVKLGLMRVAKANSNDFYYIPVWKFFIDLEHTDEFYKRTGKEPLGDNYLDKDGKPTIALYGNLNNTYSLGLSVITINALDGSIIDSGLGH